MKTLFTALALAALIIAPASIRSATAAPSNEGWDQSTQGPGGTYGGYPLREWYRNDKW